MPIQDANFFISCQNIEKEYYTNILQITDENNLICLYRDSYIQRFSIATKINITQLH